jgi:hypothetical protein
MDNSSPEMSKLWDSMDAAKVKQHPISPRCGDRFMKIRKTLKIPFNLHERYREWLKSTTVKADGSTITDTDIPYGDGTRGHTVAPKITFPKPTGSAWRKLIAAKQNWERQCSAENQRLETLAVQQVPQELDD